MKLSEYIGRLQTLVESGYGEAEVEDSYGGQIGEPEVIEIADKA